VNFSIWIPIENSVWRPVTDEQIRIVWNSSKLGFTFRSRGAAKVAMVDRRYGRSPDLQTHEFNTIVDQQHCIFDQAPPRGLGEGVVVIAWNNHLPTMR
jgi:hypothetical protein